MQRSCSPRFAAHASLLPAPGRGRPDRTGATEVATAQAPRAGVAVRAAAAARARAAGQAVAVAPAAAGMPEAAGAPAAVGARAVGQAVGVVRAAVRAAAAALLSTAGPDRGIARRRRAPRRSSAFKRRSAAEPSFSPTTRELAQRTRNSAPAAAARTFRRTRVSSARPLAWARSRALAPRRCVRRASCARARRRRRSCRAWRRCLEGPVVCRVATNAAQAIRLRSGGTNAPVGFAISSLAAQTTPNDRFGDWQFSRASELAKFYPNEMAARASSRSTRNHFAMLSAKCLRRG